MTVYFARRGSDGLIKIGTSNSVEYRIRLLAETNGAMELLATTDGFHRMEGRFHALVYDAHVIGEWFRPTERVMAVVSAVKHGFFDFAKMPDVPSPMRSEASQRAWVKRRAQVLAA